MELVNYVLVFITIVHTGLGLPHTNNQGIQIAQFGYQNPILAAPTKTESGRAEIEEPEPSPSSLENPCSIDDYDYESETQPYAYDPASFKCYPVNRLGDRGPCKQNMKFYQRPDNPSYGFCDCDQRIPAVYNPATDGCHLLFHREFCPPGQWLQLDENAHLKCTLNPCLQQGLSSTNEKINDETTILFEGNCVQLGTACGRLTTVGFFGGSLKPTCDGSVSAISNVGGGSLASLECTKAGSRWSYATGTCKKTVSYSFSR